MIKHLGQVQLPAGLAGVARKLAIDNAPSCGSHEVDRNTPGEPGAYAWGLVEDLLIDKPHEDFCFLVFRQVVEHTDKWGYIYRNGRHLLPGFLHVVVYGKASVKLGRNVLHVERGDMFVMDTSKKHSVISDTLCATVTATVALCDYR